MFAGSENLLLRPHQTNFLRRRQAKKPLPQSTETFHCEDIALLAT
jgi:hypothetical protein